MFEKIKSSMKEIISIVNECPEPFKERCFEILLNQLIAESSNTGAQVKSTVQETTLSTPELPATEQPLEITATDFHMKTRRFIELNGISYEELNKLYYKEGEFLKPLYETLGTNQIATSQIRLALLKAFENSQNTGEMLFEGESVRDLAKIMKCYDTANFTANFKKNAQLFEDFDKYEKGKEYKLSQEGKKELVETIKALCRG